jgi:hypothetical protein
LQQNPGQVKTGPGIIVMAPVGTAVPAMTVAGSVFTNGFPGWRSIGYTDAGTTFAFGQEVAEVEVAEEAYPIRSAITKRTGKASLSMSGVNQRNLQLALNGGTWTESGSGATKVSKYSPPSGASADRVMFAWIGDDSDEILIAYKTLQVAEFTVARKKGSDKASLTGMEFMFERPDTSVSSDVWNYWYAGDFADSLDAES